MKTRRSVIVNGALLAAWLLVDRRNRAAAQDSIEQEMTADAALLEDLVAANRILVNHGVLDTLGHVSVRNDRKPSRYLLSRSRAPMLVQTEDIEEYDYESRPTRANEHPMYLERFIHGAIYEAVLMRGHGTVVVGPSLPMVVRRSIALALNARLQQEAMALAGR